MSLGGQSEFASLPLDIRTRNSGRRTCDRRQPEEQDPALPEHVDECECPNHDGVCEVCGYKITVSTSGTEYGHARKTNRLPGVLGDCPHRPSSVDTQRDRGGRT